MSFKGKVVIVTGSSAGIGAATAIIFAKEGAKLTIVGRNTEKLAKVEKECLKLSGNKPLSVVADVTKDDEARGIVNKTVQHFGKLDVLVNNAGVSDFRSVFDPDYMTQFDRIMATNLRAVAILTTAALPHLVKTKGNIVNVSSIAAFSPSGILSHYCSSKAGLDHLSRSIASEVASKGVRVNVVNPGPVKTEIHQTTGISEEKIAANEKRLPLGFMTESDEVGDLILFLASDKARSITGSTYVIDAGTALSGLTATLQVMRS